jgi:hypothetical protein
LAFTDIGENGHEKVNREYRKSRFHDKKLSVKQKENGSQCFFILANSRSGKLLFSYSLIMLLIHICYPLFLEKLGVF